VAEEGTTNAANTRSSVKAPNKVKKEVAESKVEASEKVRDKSKKHTMRKGREPSEKNSGSNPSVSRSSSALFEPSVSTSAGSANSRGGSIPENELSPEDKASCLVTEGVDESAQQSEAPKEQEHEVANTLKATVHSSSQSEAPKEREHGVANTAKATEQSSSLQQHDSNSPSPDLVNIETASAPVLGREAGLEAKIEVKQTVAQQVDPRDFEVKASPAAKQMDMFSSFFAFACCRSPPLADDRSIRSFEDFRAQPEVDACLVGA
jgi:hypothetical protein